MPPSLQLALVVTAHAEPLACWVTQCSPLAPACSPTVLLPEVLSPLSLLDMQKEAKRLLSVQLATVTKTRAKPLAPQLRPMRIQMYCVAQCSLLAPESLPHLPRMTAPLASFLSLPPLLMMPVLAPLLMQLPAPLLAPPLAPLLMLLVPLLVLQLLPLLTTPPHEPEIQTASQCQLSVVPLEALAPLTLVLVQRQTLWLSHLAPCMAAKVPPPVAPVEQPWQLAYWAQRLAKPAWQCS